MGTIMNSRDRHRWRGSARDSKAWFVLLVFAGSMSADFSSRSVLSTQRSGPHVPRSPAAGHMEAAAPPSADIDAAPIRAPLAEVFGDEGPCHPGGSSLTRTQALADLRAWYARVMAVHPDPYAYVDPPALDRALAAAEAGLGNEIESMALYLAIARLSAMLRDSHTLVLPPARSDAPRFHWIIDAGRLCFTRSIRSIPAGSCVESMHGLPVERVLNASRALAAAETPAGRDALAPGLVPFALWSGAFVLPLEVTARTPAGELVRVEMDGARAEPISPQPALSTEWLTPEYARITLRTMVLEAGDYALAFAKLFGSLRRERVRGLVVDLRENDGGSTAVAEWLLSYLTRRPFRVAAAKIWRVSEAMQHQLKEKGGGPVHYMSATPGAFVTARFAPETPREVEDPFEGPVIYLIGPKTISAAMMMANAVADYRLGFLIGEPTSSPPNFFGEVHEFTLPCSGLTAQVSTARFIRANGDEHDPRPVEPSLHVPRSLAQAIEGADPVLATAVAALDYWRDRDESSHAARTLSAVTSVQR